MVGFHFHVTFEVPEKSMFTVDTGVPPGGGRRRIGEQGLGGVVMEGWIPYDVLVEVKSASGDTRPCRVGHQRIEVPGRR